ncbi:MAG: type II toxin-antitoxin system VapC family toxin [Allorhizobium sp.]
MRIYLDTNVFIAASEQRGAMSDLVGSLVSADREEGGKTFLTSELTISELLVVPLREGKQALVGYYKHVLSQTDWLQVDPVARPILISAAELRAGRKGLRLPDATHLATAMAAGCNHFLTEDSILAAMGESAAPAIRMIRPDEPTLTSLLQSLAA